jgi:hypothetical protein
VTPLGIPRTEIVFNSVTEQQFVAEDLPFFGKNRLASYETIIGVGLELCFSRFGGRISHY